MLCLGSILVSESLFLNWKREEVGVDGDRAGMGQTLIFALECRGSFL